MILVSLEPVKSMPKVKAEDDTRSECPLNVRISISRSMSQISTPPLDNPTASNSPWGFEETEQIYSSYFWVSSRMLAGVYRQTLLSSPIERVPLLLQSSRLRQQSSRMSGASSTFSGERWMFLFACFLSVCSQVDANRCLTVDIEQPPPQSSAFFLTGWSGVISSLDISRWQASDGSQMRIGMREPICEWVLLGRCGMKRSVSVFLVEMSYIFVKLQQGKDKSQFRLL